MPPSLILYTLSFILLLTASAQTPIPLPEHPRPDLERPSWLNLNGPWQFRPDPANQGLHSKWHTQQTNFPLTIAVPFPWGSVLSGVQTDAQIAWYTRTIKTPETWNTRRVFLVIGASDWETQAWLDDQPLGTHRGGYTPFEFELTPHLKPGAEHRLTLRIDDADRPFKLEGKQGYGNARGIWQTVYLEARPQTHITAIHFTPDPANSRATLRIQLNQPAPAPAELRLSFPTADAPEHTAKIQPGAKETTIQLPIPNPRLWTLDDPFLYHTQARLTSAGQTDTLNTYFGMRTIGVTNLPGTDHPYIALNGKPVYLQMCLDQSYHPEGFYTFPSDTFMRDEILRSKKIGLNANRFHVKLDIPRKLYWADRLGLLVMADVPNSWGEPKPDMRAEIDLALRGMIHRDFNHPSIFAWVPFNETWGLWTETKEKKRGIYLPETQEWVASIYQLAKQLDPSRLVEDNSPCNHDHVQTDINSWHAYLPGYEWKQHLDQITKDTFPGSKWNFIGDRTQSNQPLLNSECGNVWGYDGSTGDVDYSWDYHIMMNEFRRHPKICGWLYTEHHDVTNEWNGYYKFDRSEKITGLDEILPGISLRDLHSPYYIAPAGDLCQNTKPGQQLTLPLWASFMTDHAPTPALRLRSMLTSVDRLGSRRYHSSSTQEIQFKPWLSAEINPLQITIPNEPGLATLSLILEDLSGGVLHRNFTTFLIADGPAPRDESQNSIRLLRFAPATFTKAEWSQKQWNILDGLKVNGAGHGYFEYTIPWPKNLAPGQINGATLLLEASAKKLLAKDRPAAKQEGDFMRGKGTFDPGLNPNAYPMTDTTPFPSILTITASGQPAGQFQLPDDPADHRGILSWHAQPRDRKLREPGSYGYLIRATIPTQALQSAAQSGHLTIRLEADPALDGGLAIYSENFGRYPLDPTIILSIKTP